MIGSLNINLSNKCEDSVAKGKNGFAIALIVIGILMLLYIVYEIVSGYYSQT
uniref:Uncharacterized protein n=1 Tax=Pithovirus LCPAC401 TaxID=2506595 RepID=A0A481ZBN0_9VIRU|nr:MAG: uncharacterized protein LCPAC401_01270 [Pithovirus LCPAC401]